MAKLAPKASVFTREELFGEYKSKVMYGFLEGICLFSNVYESQLKKHESDRERHHRYLTSFENHSYESNQIDLPAMRFAFFNPTIVLGNLAANTTGTW